MVNYKNNLDDLLKDETLTREQKTQAINEYYDNYRKSIDRDLNNYLTKQYIGAGLQIGSAAIPMSGAANIGSKIGIDLLSKTVGKKIAGEVGAGAVSGMTSGAMFGTGRGLSEGENVLKTMYEDSRNGMNFGILGGGAGAYAKRFIDGKLLKNAKDVVDMNPEEIKKLRQMGKQYYKDYIQGRKIDAPMLDNINFPGSQAGEIGLHNYKMIPEIPKQIKTSNNLRFSNDKPNRIDADNFNKVYNSYNGKNYEYVIRKNSNNTGHDFYQIKEVGSKPAYSNQPRALGLEPNTIINDVDKNINPATKDTPAGTPLTTSQGSNRSISSSPAYSHQNRALGLEPNIIINDVDKNINPTTVMVPGIIFGNSPSITKDTPVRGYQTTSLGPNKSIPGTNSANPIQTRAQDLGPSIIINDAGKNIKPVTKDTPAGLTRATSTVPSESIPGTNSATPIQTRAQDLGPSTIINDIDNNINPATVMVPGIVFGNRPSMTKDTPTEGIRATSTGRSGSIPGSNSANPIQTRAQDLGPSIIINDAGKNINTSQVASPEPSARTFKLRAEKFDWRTMPLADPWKKDKGDPTGYAAPVANNGQVFTPEQIGNMSREEFDKNESAIMSQMKDGLIQTQSPSTNFSGFTNPVSGSKQIFSREDIGAMSTDEFSNNEKAINAQLNSIGVPTSNELHNATKGGGAVYIEPYIRSDGVQVKGYYRAR